MLLADKLSMDVLNMETLLAVILLVDMLRAEKLSTDTLNMDALFTDKLNTEALIIEKRDLAYVSYINLLETVNTQSLLTLNVKSKNLKGLISTTTNFPEMSIPAKAYKFEVSGHSKSLPSIQTVKTEVPWRYERQAIEIYLHDCTQYGSSEEHMFVREHTQHTETSVSESRCQHCETMMMKCF
jgi:hypothetical protein